MTTKKIDWGTNLPDLVVLGDHLSTARAAAAAAMNSRIEALRQHRNELNDAYESIQRADPLDVDPEELESRARKIRLSITKAMQAEIVLRTDLAEFATVADQERQAAIDRLKAELGAAMEFARETLRASGFGRFVDASPDNYDARQRHESALGWLLRSHDDSAAIVDRLVALGADGFKPFNDGTRLTAPPFENSIAIRELRRRIDQAKRELMPAL